jgi:type IV secretion system protein VirB8
VVSVRYTRTITRGDDIRTTHWVATITYSYANAPTSSSDRLVNPLGFVVSEYRADPEALN